MDPFCYPRRRQRDIGLVLSVRDHGEVLLVNIFVSPVIAELLPFDCLNFNDFFRPQP